MLTHAMQSLAPPSRDRQCRATRHEELTRISSSKMLPDNPVVAGVVPPNQFGGLISAPRPSTIVYWSIVIGNDGVQNDQNRDGEQGDDLCAPTTLGRTA